MRADAGNAVTEPDTLANNVATGRPITLNSPAADLTIDAVFGAQARQARKDICMLTDVNRVRASLNELFERAAVAA